MKRGHASSPSGSDPAGSGEASPHSKWIRIPSRQTKPFTTPDNLLEAIADGGCRYTKPAQTDGYKYGTYPRDTRADFRCCQVSMPPCFLAPPRIGSRPGSVDSPPEGARGPSLCCPWRCTLPFRVRNQHPATQYPRDSGSVEERGDTVHVHGVARLAYACAPACGGVRMARMCMSMTEAARMHAIMHAFR